MKKYISYAFFFVTALFMSFNSVFADGQERVCTYQFGGNMDTLIVNVYFGPGGASAYTVQGLNKSQRVDITNSVQNYFSSDDYLNGSKSCPSNAWASVSGKKISFSVSELNGDIRQDIGVKQGSDKIESASGGIYDPNDEPVHVDPPGGFSSILTGACPTNFGFVKLLGTLYGLLKIAAPILLIIFGMLDFAKAVASTDEGKMKKAQSAFVRRLIAAVVVFLVMSLMTLLSNLIPEESGVFSCVKNILK